jgi:hypothetical protein
MTEALIAFVLTLMVGSLTYLTVVVGVIFGYALIGLFACLMVLALLILGGK